MVKEKNIKVKQKLGIISNKRAPQNTTINPNPQEKLLTKHSSIIPAIKTHAFIKIMADNVINTKIVLIFPAPKSIYQKDDNIYLGEMGFVP